MPPSRSATQLALILPLKAPLDLTDAERDELVRALRRIVHDDQFQLSPRIRRLRQILDKLEPPGLAPRVSAPDREAQAKPCGCYGLEKQARSRTKRAMAISAASDAAEAVLRMNQNISKPSTLAGKDTAAASPGM